MFLSSWKIFLQAQRPITTHEEAVKKLFDATIDPQYRKQTIPTSSGSTRATLAQCKALLTSDSRYWLRQGWLLHQKTGRSAHCSFRACKAKLEVGTECFVVTGALAVVRGDTVVNTKFYFCADKPRCISGNFSPVYSNVQQPVDFDSDETEARMRVLGIVRD